MPNITAAGRRSWRDRFRAPALSLPLWAPDTPDHLVYSANTEGKQEWYAWNRATGNHRRVTDRPTGSAHPTRLDPTGSWIWWFDDDRGDEFGSWRRQPFGGGDDQEIPTPPGYSAGIAVGTTRALIGSAASDHHQIDAVDTTGGDPPAPDQVTRLYETAETVWVAGLSADQSLAAIAHSEHGDSRNPALRVIDRHGATVADEWDGPGRGLFPGAWAREPGDNRLLIYHERHGVTRPALWHPASGATEELDLGPLQGEVGASWYPGGDGLLLVHLWRGRTELYRYTITAATLERLDPRDGFITDAAVRDDGELWLHHSSSAVPPLVSCGSQELTPPGMGDPAPGGVAYQDVQVGEVHGFLAEPPGARPHPTLFWVHGGPAGLDAEYFSPTVQAFVDHGLAVVLVNYRGSAGYGKAWRDAIVGMPGLSEITDIRAVRDHLVASGVARPGAVALGGASWGGFLTLLGLSRQPDAWSLGLSVVPLADLARHYHQQSVPLQAYWRDLFGGTPDEIGHVLAEVSPIELVDRLDAPLLIMAGDNDPRCPLPQVLSYVARLDAEGKPYELYRYDAGHGAMVTDEQIHQMEVQLDFCHRHLGTTTVLP